MPTAIMSCQLGFGDAHCDRDLARREEVKEEEKKEEENQTPLIKSDDPHLTWQVGGKKTTEKGEEEGVACLYETSPCKGEP